MMAKSEKKQKQKKKNKKKLIICLAAELVLVALIVILLGRNHSLGDWIYSMTSGTVKSLDLDGIYSNNAVLISASGKHVIGEIEKDQIIYPASMTKIMTAILCLEKISDLDQEISLDSDIFPDLYAQDASRAGFEPGETVRAIDLIYGVMLPSGAECCIGLARYISGSEEAFVDLMNEKAKRIGMKNTHFCDTTGLHDPDHYSTVYDMAILLRYALTNDTFRQIAESPWHSTAATNIHPDGITFYSTLFKGLDDTGVTGGDISGGKTGYTGEAGYCLASYAQIAGHEYILVTAGAPGANEHIEDAVTIYNRLGEKALS